MPGCDSELKLIHNFRIPRSSISRSKNIFWKIYTKKNEKNEKIDIKQV